MTDTPKAGGAQLRPRDELLAVLDDFIGATIADIGPSKNRTWLSLLSEATERIRADATAPSRSPTREITMQDVRLIAGEGELSAATVLDAVNAHLRREAGRAPVGGDLVERLRSAARSWRRDDAEKARDPEAEASLWDEAADELARLAVSRAGDRERLEVTTAAIRFEDGLVATMPRPHRHGSLINRTYRERGETRDHGFMLTNGSYADRKRAYEVAEAAGQIAFPHVEGALSKPYSLFTEHLWADEPPLAPAAGQDDAGECG